MHSSRPAAGAGRRHHRRPRRLPRESGADPEEEFGPAADFAAQFGPRREAAGDAPDGDTRLWTADIFADERRLNEFGAQGWEVERVDKRGRFVSHRDSDRRQRWEYRREAVTPADGGR